MLASTMEEEAMNLTVSKKEYMGRFGNRKRNGKVVIILLSQ